jgi:hypothetical protein
MPSFVVGGISGGQPLFSSGLQNPWSGAGGGSQWPVGGILLRYGAAGMSGNLSGLVYVGFSGGITINSGGLPPASGAVLAGLRDGMPMAAGDTYFVPRLACGGFSGIAVGSGLFSGSTPPPNVWFTCDAGASGQARMYYEFL